MKIAAINGILNQKRGAELAFLNMVKSLKKRGHEIDVFTLSVSEYFENKLGEDDIPVSSTDFFTGPFGRLFPIRILKDLVGLVYFYKLSKHINNSYDVAFIHHHDFAPLIMPFLKIPKVYYCQEPPRDYYETYKRSDRTLKQKLLRAILFIPLFINKNSDKYLDRYCVKFSDLILSNSDYSREYIWRTYGLFPVTNYLGVDNKIFNKLDIPKSATIVSIGAIYPAKGHDFMVRSIGLVPEEKRPALTIVGTGSLNLKQYLVQLAEETDVKLDIKNDLLPDEMCKLYNEAKLVGITYVMPPFPLAAIESMACGTPVVGLREGGLREIVTPKTGILTKRSEEDFAKAIAYLMDNPEVSTEMGKGGLERVRKLFTWEKCGENLEKNFKMVLIDRGK